MPTYETISRAELVSRLDVHMGDLISREEAATIVGIEKTYLSNLGADGPAYYRSTKAPRGGVAWYLRANVEQYARQRREKTRFTGETGEQPWPLERNAGVPPVHSIVTLIEKWKRRELYRRAEKILEDPLRQDEELKDELRMFGTPWPDGRQDALVKHLDNPDPSERREIFKSLDEQEVAIQRKLRLICDQAGAFPSFVHPSYPVLAGLMEAAWRDVVKSHYRWFQLDYTGMPSERPD